MSSNRLQLPGVELNSPSASRKCSPEEFRFLRFRITNLRKLALAEAAGGDSTEALAHVQQSLELVRTLETQHSENRELDPELHAGLLALADISLSLERSNDAMAKFARLLDVDVGTLRSWEQVRRQPTGPARALLRAIKRDPKAVLKALAA